MDTITDEGRTQRPDAELSFCADIEQAALETHCHCQAGQDVRSNRSQAFCEWIDRQQEGFAVTGCKIALDASDRYQEDCRVTR